MLRYLRKKQLQKNILLYYHNAPTNVAHIVVDCLNSSDSGTVHHPPTVQIWPLATSGYSTKFSLKRRKFMTNQEVINAVAVCSKELKKDGLVKWQEQCPKYIRTEVGYFKKENVYLKDCIIFFYIASIIYFWTVLVWMKLLFVWFKIWAMIFLIDDNGPRHRTRIF